MTQQTAASAARSSRARDAWAALPHGGHDATRLQIQCARSHHVATVYDTTEGLVLVTTLHAHSHGSRDRVDVPHGGRPVAHWVDLLAPDAPGVDDAVPAWCDCGHRTLSRAAIVAWMADGERRVVVD